MREEVVARGAERGCRLAGRLRRFGHHRPRSGGRSCPDANLPSADGRGQTPDGRNEIRDEPGRRLVVDQLFGSSPMVIRGISWPRRPPCHRCRHPQRLWQQAAAAPRRRAPPRSGDTSAAAHVPTEVKSKARSSLRPTRRPRRSIATRAALHGALLGQKNLSESRRSARSRSSADGRAGCRGCNRERRRHARVARPFAIARLVLLRPRRRDRRSAHPPVQHD
jgi:hypothetical protein